MDLELRRIANGKDSTLGMLHIDGQFQCFTLEDEFRETKVKGETRIPHGKYEIKFREEPSPLTTRYRQRFDWFNFHLQLQNVKGFEYVYIHVGNTDDNTDGCILVGRDAYSAAEYTIGKSVDAFRELYLLLKQALKTEKVYIHVNPY